MATSVKLSLCLAPNDRLSAAATAAAAGVLGARIAVAGVLGAEIAVAEPRGDLALACIFEYYQEGCACVESRGKPQTERERSHVRTRDGAWGVNVPNVWVGVRPIWRIR